MSDSSIETKISNLISWGESHGCQIDPRIKFVYNNDGSGVSAILNLPEGGRKDDQDDQDIVIDISNDVILTPEVAHESLKEVIPPTALESLDGFQVLQVYLTFLRHGENYVNSNWLHYINLLPLEISSPLAWSSNDLNLYLSNTNLINGCHLKLREIYKKFLNFRKLLVNSVVDDQQDENQEHDIEYIQSLYHSYCDDDNNMHHWFNFKSYLWSYLIITSRSFPYKLIHDSDELFDSKFNKLNSVILLPIIDLLNHKPKSKIYWNGNIANKQNFKITKLIKDYQNEVCETSGDGNTDLQIYNNYGPKGNEELLMGYGFTIRGNEFDTLLLSLNISKLLSDLQNDDSGKLIENFNLFLPTLESYTNSIVDRQPGNNDGNAAKSELIANPIYISNINHIIPKGLLELYCFINRKDKEEHISLNSLLNSINDLRKSLNMKYKNKFSVTNNNDTDNSINYNEINSNNYKIGQLNLYNLFIKNLKNLEKKLLKIYRKNLIIKKDLVKKSIEFNEFLNDLEIHDFISNELYFIIWILYIVSPPPPASPESDSFRPDWIIAKFKEYTKTDTAEYEVHDITPVLSKYWGHTEFQIANKVLLENSYLKGSDQEIILIESDIIIQSLEEFL
ncbi:hypothetical protein B5S30_g2321 [[Candida] boidinii]|nr:hypothetical protein B5S30_g2321 [[Candida] boidinii]